MTTRYITDAAAIRGLADLNMPRIYGGKVALERHPNVILPNKTDKYPHCQSQCSGVLSEPNSQKIVRDQRR